MPKLEHIKDLINYTPDKGTIVVFYTEENGKVVLKAKKSDGTVETILEGD